ncbi:short chain dehydrogenase [Parachryseolinea silvisoli]|uniref:short chain dehydrogenase n=1 Tax=Parachryseolinea silvisoli TaxID=2873601 RepID=UPI002265A9EF|nr:short chain dehydrogenase [Parachryseolinea silvisoli]MCD9015358.1 short chain dehydrogenase [Parachryseolinea silvisoli]
MKIIIIGASGTIGKHVVKALEQGHEILKAGSKSGDLQVNLNDPDSIKQMYEKAGSFDAVVCVAGDGHFGPLNKMTDADFRVSVNSKLMGQVNLVLIGQHYINPKGSFTLTSGSLGDDPVVLGTSLSAVNAAIDGFVRGASIELENGVRINSVGPDVVEESPGYFPYFQGRIPVSMHRVAQSYVKSVAGAQTGKAYKVYN